MFFAKTSNSWRDFVSNLVIAAVIAIFIRSFIFAVYRIPTSSMMPSLMPGDFIWAVKYPYGFDVFFSSNKIGVLKKPEAGNLYVFRYKNNKDTNYVKRVVAIAGDKVEIRGHDLFVNDKKLTSSETCSIVDPFAGMEYYECIVEQNISKKYRLIVKKQNKAENYGPVQVPEGHVFVLGDNRDASDDSRYWGMVPEHNIDAKVEGLWLSLDWNVQSLGASLPAMRWHRMFRSIDSL